MRKAINRVLWTLACWVLVPVAAGVTFGVIALCAIVVAASAVLCAFGLWFFLQMVGVS